MKFCENCGGQVEETEMFCPHCGQVQRTQNSVEPVMEQPQYGNQNRAFQNNNPQAFNKEPYEQGDLTAKKKSKAPLIIGLSVGIVSLIVAITLIVILLVVNNGGESGESARDVAEKYLKACYVTFDGTEAMQCVAYTKDYKNELRDRFSSFYFESSDWYFDPKYEILSEKKLSKSEKEDFWFEYHNDVYVDEDDVGNITKIEVELSYTCRELLGGYDTESKTYEMYIGKYKGEWKVLNP